MSIQEGRKAEQAACQYLLQQGLTKISQNFSSNFGEIDLIMLENEELVFVEVRARKQQTFGAAIETVNHNKQKKIIRTAQYFLTKNPKHSSRMIRFDILVINNFNTINKEIEWIQNAFELSGFSAI